MLKSVHLEQVTGMRFRAYNNLFSIVKGAEDTLPAIASRVEEAIAHIIELCPKQITEVSTSPGGFMEVTCDNAIGNLDNELALMALLNALPREEYADFISSFMRQKDLTRADVEAVFQVEQTKRNAHRSPLPSSLGNTNLCPAVQPPRQNKPGVKDGFCNSDRHTEEDCYKQERHACCDSSKKAHTTRDTATSPSLPTPADGAKVTELAASTNVRLTGSPDTHADAHCIADTGATSHMSPRHSWFTKLEPLAIPIRVTNDHVVYSKGVHRPRWSRCKTPACWIPGQAT
jgi:hypothetical protein